jgi:DNA-binding response OmpR family regulator
LSDRHFSANWADRNKIAGGLKLDQLTFMIVDPSELMRELLRDVLRTLGAREVLEAIDGSEAIRRMNPSPPDILITEWEMAPMNGLDLTGFIRTSGECSTPQMPIIMTSAYSDANRVCVARDSGITEYLIKPLSAASLYARIRAVIENPRLYIKSDSYTGPDRRRHKKDREGEERRVQPQPSPIISTAGR